MILPSYDKALKLAQRLSVLDQKTGSLIPFDLNQEQREVLRCILEHQRLVIVKGRQIGCSTVSAYFVVLAALMNPGLPICIIADEQVKSEGLLMKIKGWLKELGVKLHKDNVRSCILANGANIDAISAMSTSEDDESRVGRSKSYGCIWGTEQAFWRNARAVWAALTSTAGLSAKILVESTGSPAGELFESLARNAVDARDVVGDQERYARLFFGVEHHEAYRRDPKSIEDELFQQLREKHGFQRRDAAAWWEWKRTTDLGGDTQRALREYPVTFDDAFAFPLGRYYRQWHPAAVTTVDGWDIYENEAEEEPRVMAAMASTGLGKEPSSIAEIGMWSGTVYATWTDFCEIPSFCNTLVRAYDARKPKSLVVEVGNDPGCELVKLLADKRNVSVYAHHTTESSWLRMRSEMRSRIEGGQVKVGEQLHAEIKHVFLDDKSGKIRGEETTTLTKAVALALEWARIHPESMPAKSLNPNKVYIRPRRKKTRVRA